jgi:hypothetical protein
MTTKTKREWVKFAAICIGAVTREDVEMQCEYCIVKRRPRKIKIRKITFGGNDAAKGLTVHHSRVLWYYNQLRRAILEHLS